MANSTKIRKTRSASSVTIALDQLTAKLGAFPQMPVKVSRGWALATQEALGVNLGVTDEPETSAPASTGDKATVVVE